MSSNINAIAVEVQRIRLQLDRIGYTRIPRDIVKFTVDSARVELLTRLELCRRCGCDARFAAAFMPFKAKTFGIATNSEAPALFHVINGTELTAIHKNNNIPIEHSPFSNLVDLHLFRNTAGRTFHPGGPWEGEESITLHEGTLLRGWNRPGRIGDVDLVPVVFEWDQAHSRHYVRIGSCADDGRAAFWALPGSVMLPNAPEEWGVLASHFPRSHHVGLWGLCTTELGTASERKDFMQIIGQLLEEPIDPFQTFGERLFHHCFPITFPDAALQLRSPSTMAEPCNFWGDASIQGWHCDYYAGDLHSFDKGTDHGLVAIVLLTDCAEVSGGGTLLIPGSHHWVREFQRRQKRPCSHKVMCDHFDIQLSEHFRSLQSSPPQPLQHPIPNPVRITDHFYAPPLLLPGQIAVDGALMLGQAHGKSGDVWLMHPWLLHTGSRNKDTFRAMTNFTIKTRKFVRL